MMNYKGHILNRLHVFNLISTQTSFKYFIILNYLGNIRRNLGQTVYYI